MLYLCQSGGDFVRQMPIFDEWGARPTGLQGSRENPVVVTALPVSQGGSSSSGGAGRHEAPEAEEAPGGDTALGEAREEAVIGARAAEAEGDKQLPSAPTTGATEAQAAFPGEAIGGAHQAGAPDADRLDASSSS